MTENLKAEIQNLHHTFSVYVLNRGMNACPCCVSEARKEVLYSKPLKQLSAEELSHYYWKAMTTWGEVEDFKHFLPRFFELLAGETCIFETFVIFGKLEYADWRTWPADEKEAIKSFVVAWWVHLTLSDSGFEGSDFLNFYAALGGVQPLLDNWHIVVGTATFKSLVHFIFDDYQMYKAGKEIDEKEYLVLNKWLAGQCATIAEGFYYYEQTDPEFAQKISYCYDIVLRIA